MLMPGYESSIEPAKAKSRIGSEPQKILDDPERYQPGKHQTLSNKEKTDMRTKALERFTCIDGGEGGDPTASCTPYFLAAAPLLAAAHLIGIRPACAA